MTGIAILSLKSIFNKVLQGRKKLNLVLFSLFAVIILVTDVAFFIVSFEKPLMGIFLSYNNQHWYVESIDPNGIAYQAGIQVGDIPVEINNQPAQSFLSDYTKIGTIYRPLIKEIEVTGKNGIITADLQNRSPTASDLGEMSISFLTCLIFWLVGFYVLIKKPMNLAARLFCLCGLFFGLTVGASVASWRSITLGIPVAVSAMAVSPFLLLHFFHILPEEREKARSNPLIYLIYLPPVITIILFFIVGYLNGQVVPWFRNIRIIELALALAGVAVIAILNYIRSTSARTKQQMKIMVASTVAAFVPFLFLNFIFLEIWKQNNIPFGFNLLFISLIPIGMGYAIVTQKLLDIDLIIRRGVIYSFISIIMAIILSAGIVPVFILRTSIDITREILVALGLGIVATMLFGPVTRWTELAVDRLFYKDRYDYRQIIHNLSNSINRLNDFEDISRVVVVTTRNALSLTGACLFVKSEATYEIRAAYGSFDDFVKQEELISYYMLRNPLYEFPNTASIYDAELAFLIPLVAGEKEIGLMCVSQKISRQNFSGNDIYLLQGIATVAATSLRSAILLHDVSIRNTFISIASHELRTPLTSIVGFSDLILNHGIPDQDTLRTWIKSIYDNGRKLTVMVDQFLNVSRIQSDKNIMKLEPANIEYILDNQIMLIKQLTGSHEFIVKVETDLPEVMVDRDKFGHVVGNLLNNAVKYSPNGGNITVSAYIDNKEQSVIVSITDEGIGISESDRVSLFTTFHRINRPETANVSGSGLGLYIAKKWTEAMGSKIWLQSELDKGSTFFISMPIYKKDDNGGEKVQYKTD